MKTFEELNADEDAKKFGLGFTRKHPDGTIEYLPPDQIRIHQPKAEEVSIQTGSPYGFPGGYQGIDGKWY